jgi:hypothetical protein
VISYTLQHDNKLLYPLCSDALLFSVLYDLKARLLMAKGLEDEFTTKHTSIGMAISYLEGGLANHKSAQALPYGLPKDSQIEFCLK